jgi:hypothetical protein
LLTQFRKHADAPPAVSKAVFIERVRSAELLQSIPTDDGGLAAFLLPKIHSEPNRGGVVDAMNNWIDEHFH